ncbi:glycosyltransferase family A protein [Yersinia mollaretii]|uniref:WbcL protein n=1 Tax=Yersinia mollaretii TaxID=33060 RepID=A0AA36LP30_YERMO|nr:glycosyltransferase family 2 protein [Yersinia mollaretii]MDA5526294.1 glycosyltransferase family 2 protein [Yersinia mollaretii]MDR7873115.1 glycosyltransferase family 2 protein [Yersinia mollaretii]PHZ32906.1 glycosyltransferase family 2 protein [Yersinia mollaretii]WQC76222.1 glycosyltransferase family 2 protein [Yersinia mollaretii]CNF02423.1 WbcL protein [Yersinia mollaretii]
MTAVTVFTPTFNRAHVLTRCYLSILEQSRDDIEWLVIDDGSTDNTIDVIKKFQNENKIKITYIYQNNSGKQAAWNTAVKNAEGEYFIGLDSDDALVAGSIDKLLSMHKVFDDKRIIGIRAISVSSDTMKPNNCYLSNKDKKKSWFDEFRSGVRGERIDFFKTELLCKYLYPVVLGVNFIPEIWFYSTVSKEYYFYYSSICVRVFFDDEKTNRLSKSSIKKHAVGHYISRKALLENMPKIIWLYRPLDFIKSVLRINQALAIIDNKFIDHSKSSVLVKIVTFPGVIINKIKRQ